MTSPKMPRANFCQRGALTIGSKNAGRAISALEPARDLEGHEARCLGDLLACHDDVHFLEPSGCPEVLHEVRHRGRGERRAPEEEDSAFFLDARDPEVLRNDVGEGVQEPQRPALGLRQLVDDLHALSKFGCPGGRRGGPAATPRDGRAAPTTSGWPPPTSIRANGWASSTGMPHVEER